jgi:hypothetical protein
MSHKPFYAGMEEAVSRILALFASLIFFSIYILSKNINLSLDWGNLMIHLAVFWFVYELISYFLFLIFTQFSRSKSKDEPQVINKDMIKSLPVDINTKDEFSPQSLDNKDQ